MGMQSNNSSLRNMMKSQYREQQSMGAAYGQYGQMTQAPRVEAMRIDDVIVRTAALVGATFVAAMVTYSMVANGIATGDQAAISTAMTLGMVGMFIGLGVIIFSMFKPITNPIVAFVYAGGQGLLLGGVSAIFEQQYPGIVVNALVGTVMVFGGMLALYKFRILKNSPMFAKVMIGAGFGIFGLMMVNLGASMFGMNLGLFAGPTGDVSTLQWIIAIGITLWAAFSFILDFDMIEQSAAAGAPKKYAWAGAFGLTAGLIFLYWNLLRLLSYFQR
ncbi:Bax inhibitor-1/YccA family protein [Glycomyces buryatensis]|uniref:Bax inhibitor-1/YccA family protein n=1 Tax=Glycomyces buryatensis TaxID=2570927 RepID=A0A4S8QNJ2_9ACTN|nr:Bax inhibitor-1/YccA family protein [Glycomyces buryatensis]THV42284.1 Bax inhibitor-1/YccA family protein [Glycomyces buryatensis]